MDRNTASLLAALVGCSSGDIELRATITLGNTPEATVLTGADVSVVSLRDERVERATTNADGLFSVPVPAGEFVAVEIAAPDVATTSFIGFTGFDDVFSVPDRTLFGVPSVDVTAWTEGAEDCPGFGEPGGVVFGEIRLGNLGLDGASTPVITTGRVSVLLEEGDREACYFDAEDARVDPEQTVTGDAGAFVVFGVPPGLQLLEARFEQSEELWVGDVRDIWVADDPSSVTPLLPILLDALL